MRSCEVHLGKLVEWCAGNSYILAMDSVFHSREGGEKT